MAETRPQSDGPPTFRPFANGLRSPVVAPLTRGLLGLPLFLFSAKTATLFAWTIQPPLTAAVLGANYWASAVLAILASRERLWAHGRVSISVALVFAPVTTAATILHLGLFHTDGSGFTLFITWFWLVAYALYPLQLAVVVTRQLRTPGADPPRTHPLPSWLRGIFVVQAALLLPLGTLMLAAPTLVRGMWPWTVPVLSEQVLSAWTLAFGVLALHSLWENDLRRIRVVLWAFPAFVVLHVVAIARFGSALQWGEPGPYVYLAYLASGLALGAYGIARRRVLADPAPAGARTAG